MRGVTASRGFLGVPKCGLSPSAEKANSERLVLPSATMPALARFATIGASLCFGADSAKSAEPAVVRSPAMSTRSFQAIGTPSSGPAGRPSRCRLRLASASLRARARVTRMNDGFSLSRSMRSRKNSAASTGSRRPAAMRRPIVAPDCVSRFSIMLRLVRPPRRVVARSSRRAALHRKPVCDRLASSLRAREAILRMLWVFLIFLAGAVASGAPAFAADPFPASGSAKLAAYTVCRSAVIVDMGPVGSNSSAECIGIVKTHRRIEASGQPRDPLPGGSQSATRGLCVHRHMHPYRRRRRQDFHDL